MSDQEKLAFLLKVLKDYAEQPHCYNLNPHYKYPPHNWDIFEDGSNYGEITFARTLLEQIGEEFFNPVMREND